MGYGRRPGYGNNDVLDQLRANRRKRKARMLAFSILATVALLLVVLFVMTLRSCMGGPATEKIDISAIPADAQTTASQRAGEISFRPAPLYIAVGEQHLVTALASAARDADATSTEVEKLVAYGIADGRVAWERPVNDHLSGIFISGGHAVVHREDDSGFSARAFLLEDGSPVWDVDVPEAQRVSFANSGNRMAVAYMLTDGFRVAVYDTVTGVKSSGKILYGSDGVQLDLDQMNMRFIGDRLLYTVDRAVGMLNVENDRLWSQEGSAPVILASPDPVNSQVYVLSWGNAPDSLVLHVRDFADGSGKELDRFETTAESIVMVADDGYLLLGYSDRTEDANFSSSIRLFRKDSRDSYVRQTLQGLRIEDAMPLSSGLFVAGLNRGTGRDDNPVSGGELHLVNAEDGSVTEFESLRDNVEYTVRFGDDRLVLLDNGEIRRINLAASRAERVQRMDFPEIRPVFSPGYEVLCVISSPTGSSPGDRSSRAQALIFH